jgi:phospholipase C
MNRLAWLLLSLGCLLAGPVCAQPTNFQHIVVIFQENRTPDNLFYALCSTQPCSTHPDNKTYDIQTSNWLDKNVQGGVIQPTPNPLANTYDPGHSHAQFTAMCDQNTQTGACQMDGAGNIKCNQCPPNAEFVYVDNSHHVIDPYLFLATQYGWANYMFQTNQGPSFPAHQFIFGATSAPNRNDDHIGTFVGENIFEKTKTGAKVLYGCIAQPGKTVQLINAKGKENKNAFIYPCFEHKTLGDLLDQKQFSWRYYTPGAGSLWSAPDAIKHICKPSGGQCTGVLWQKNVATNPVEVLDDLRNCNLRNVSWVIPTGQFSDHADMNTGLGPVWVASIVNAIGNSTCKNADNSSYWDSTAIVLTWDDWGGWYDHEPPTFLPPPEGGYQYGFRVPMIFISPYTRKGYINNEFQDFGSIARFIEFNFGIPMGKLTFADARESNNLAQFYDFTNKPRPYETIKAPPIETVIDLKKLKVEPPDDD